MLNIIYRSRFIVFFSIFILILSCSKLNKKTSPFKIIVVLCDLSESTRNMRNIYFKSFKEIISSIGHGDAIYVVKITESSIEEPEIPIKEVFPEFIPKDKFGNPTDNPLIVKRERKKADEKLRRKKEKCIEDAERLFFSRERILKTDILSSLLVAEKIFKNFPEKKPILVILSDMIEDSSDYNFKKEKLTKERIREIIENEKSKGRLPDLRGVKVYVIGAQARDKEKFFSIQNFWMNYFKECGAILEKKNYGSALIKFEE